MKARSTRQATEHEQTHTSEQDPSDVASQRSGLLYVVVAVLFFATSPVFIRWSQPFQAVEIAFWRLAIAALLVTVLGIVTHQRMSISRQQLPRFISYGLVTALHFFFYIASLNYTTTAHSLALTYTSPIFVTLFSWLFLHETLPASKLLGMLVAVIGVAIMAGFEPHYTSCTLNGQCMVLGDGLALLSALCYGIYSIIGRSERTRHPLFRYTSHVYGLAALWLLPVTLLFAFQHPYPLPALGAIAALGIFPLGLGHTLYNAALRKIHATYANLIATQEVTMGIILSVIFLHDIPSLSTIIGVLVTLGGIVSVLL